MISLVAMLMMMRNSIIPKATQLPARRCHNKIQIIFFHRASQLHYIMQWSYCDNENEMRLPLPTISLRLAHFQHISILENDLKTKLRRGENGVRAIRHLQRHLRTVSRECHHHF